MNQIPHLLRPADGETLEYALHRRAKTLTAKLQETFGANYEVKMEELKPIEDKWTCEITVRQGTKVGAGVDMTWKKSKPKILELDIDKSTKMGNMLMMGVLLPCFVIGAAMGVFGIPPLDILPDTKIGGLISGLIALVPGLIIMMILRSVLLGKHKEESNQLKEEVTKVVKANFVDNPVQFYLAEGASVSKD